MPKYEKSDLEIAQATRMRDIRDIAAKLGVSEDDLEMYGRYKAKLPLHLIDQEKVEQSSMVLVTAITPTPAGEGKTTTSIGLAEGLNKIGQQAVVVLREPSLGPVFGMKGGAAGGGYSQVVPMEDINLHFTGDFSAIEKANNLLAALIDNNLNHTSGRLGIDPRTVAWKRVMDMNDRALRQITIGLGGLTGGVPREDGFHITAASEIMAILCLASGLSDLKEKIANIYIGETFAPAAERKPVFARDLHAQGAMAALLKDAIKPNLVQTLEGNPAIIHGGPFANIAQGTNSVIATRMGMSLAPFVITEAGFDAALGAEKFLNIKCGYSGLSPKAMVLVATVRALKYHGGADVKSLGTPDPDALSKGLPNLDKHIENSHLYGLPCVVSINKFVSDTDEEVRIIRQRCEQLGARVAVSEGWEHGGAGMTELAGQVVDAVASSTGPHTPVYDWAMPVQDKIRAVAQKVYGADDVAFGVQAQKDLKQIRRLNLDGLPICIAKTPNSLSDNPALLGRPQGFDITVRAIEIAAGAGFLIPMTGDIMRMPGLPRVPAAEGIDINDDGVISGLN